MTSGSMDFGKLLQCKTTHKGENVMFAQLIADMVVDRLDDRLLAVQSSTTDQAAFSNNPSSQCPTCRRPMLPRAIDKRFDEHSQHKSHQQRGDAEDARSFDTIVVDKHEPKSQPSHAKARPVSRPGSEIGRSPSARRAKESQFESGSNYMSSSTPALVEAQADMKELQRGVDDDLFQSLAAGSKYRAPPASSSRTTRCAGQVTSMPGSSTDVRGPVPEAPRPVVIGIKKVAPLREPQDDSESDSDVMSQRGSNKSRARGTRGYDEPRHGEAEARGAPGRLDPERVRSRSWSGPDTQPRRAASLGNMSRVANLGRTEAALDSAVLPIERLKTIQRCEVLEHCEVTRSRFGVYSGQPPLELLLRFVGLLPPPVCCSGGWGRCFPVACASWYQWLTPTALLVMFSFNIWACPHQPDRVMCLADTVLNLAAFSCMVSLGILTSSQELERCVALLRMADDRLWFDIAWTRKTWIDMAVMLIIWLGALMLRALSEGLLGSSADEDSLRRFFTYSFTVGAIIFVVLALQLVCRGLACMLDAFCRHIISLEDLSDAIVDWNMTEAVVRRSCAAVEHCLVVLVLTSTVCTLMCLPELFSMIETLWKHGYFGIPGTSLTVLPICLCVLWAVSTVASVTDKCTKVPSFVNHVSVDQRLDAFRHHVVQYIMNSNGGFYIYEVRVTSPMLAKAFYMVICIAVAVVSRL